MGGVSNLQRLISFRFRGICDRASASVQKTSRLLYFRYRLVSFIGISVLIVIGGFLIFPYINLNYRSEISINIATEIFGILMAFFVVDRIVSERLNREKKQRTLTLYQSKLLLI